MEWKRSSKYIPGCDGTKLAVDIYLPETKEKVPLLLKAGYAPRRIMYEMDQAAVERFLAAGYAVAFADVRGSGASYGVSDGFFGPRDGKDMAAVIKSLAAEPWCTGKAGTYGGSNHGMVQEITMLEQPEELMASIPCDCSMDFYDQDFPNGASALPDMPKNHHQEIPMGDPVDEDPAPDYPMAHEAAKCHERNLPFLAQHFPNMYRDDVHPYLGYRPNLDIPAWERMDVVRFGHVAPWSLGAWFDPGCTNKILTWKSWGGKLLIGPWPHCGIYIGYDRYPNTDYDWIGEHIRFFDAHVKGKDSGILSEPPIRYYTIGDTGNEWHYEADFPVAGTTFPRLYLTADGGLAPQHGVTDAGDVSDASACTVGAGKADKAAVCESGAGEPVDASAFAEGSVSYRVRNDVMIFEEGMRMNRDVQKDMTPEDEKSAVFTSEPVPKDMEITGIPVLDLWVTSSHTDGNFIACLEEVTPDGISHFLTEGAIRASHAKVCRNPVYESMGIPYHRSYREDVVELSEEVPMKLSFHLEALSRIIKVGSRLRVAVSCGGSGYQQPEGFPKEMPTVKIHTGAGKSALTLPVIKPVATVFTAADGRHLYVYKRAVYLEENGRFAEYPCTQVYPKGGETICETAGGTVRVRTEGGQAYAEVLEAGLAGRKDRLPKFTGKAALPDRFFYEGASEEIPLPETPWGYQPDADVKNLYVATVPVAKGDYGNTNIQLRNTFDLYIDLIYPKGEGTDFPRKNLPCIVNIHGFGGNHHQFETNTEMFLEYGYAVASVDYRLCPPNVWPTSGEDVRGCIRYLKAHAKELGLDPSRFGLIGGSMGGHLTAMLAACTGDPAVEGRIGGNEGYDCSIKAAAAYYSFTDFLHFGDDSAAVWPAQPDKVNQSDGPFAPLASLLGYVGPGKGFGVVKAHQYDPDPNYRRLLEMAAEASPISHVTEHSAPLALVHGIFDCGIQVPMGQSVRMFEALTRKGVKSLLLCNNNGLFGEDPEVKRAVVEFMVNRI